MCGEVRPFIGLGLMLSDMTTKFGFQGTIVYHFMGTSTFSEYTVAHAVSAAKVNKKAAQDKICPLGCGISTGKSFDQTLASRTHSRMWKEKMSLSSFAVHSR